MDRLETRELAYFLAVAAKPLSDTAHGAFFMLIRPVWPECHRMITVRRVAVETHIINNPRVP
jgi:hypothetical protein